MVLRIIILLFAFILLAGSSFAADTQSISLTDSNSDSAKTSEVTSLKNLIQEAVTKNPILLSLGYQVTAQGAKASWIKVRPDPMFTNATNTDKYPFRYQSLGKDPMNQVQFLLGQEFPYPGKLKLKGKIETSELETIKKEYDQTKLELTSRLKKAYYDLYYTPKSLEIIEDVKVLLETLAGTVKAKYEVGDGSQQDLLKVHLEISKLLEEYETLKKDRESYIAEINSIVIRPQGTDISSVEEITKQSFTYKTSDLLGLYKENYPLLQGQKAQVEKGNLAVKLAKKGYYPDFSVEAGYGQRANPMDPMYMFQVMSSLPVYYRSKQRKQLEEAKATLKAQEEAYNSIAVEAERKIKDLHIQIEKNETLIELVQSGIIPQARLAVDASIASYKVSKTDFLTLLDNVRTLLTSQIDYYKHLTDYEKAIAELEPLIGREL